MNFFISDAFAQAAPGSSEPPLAGLILPLAILAFFYFLFIRPQQKRQKEHKKLINALSKGNEIVTNGGLLGKVVDLDENFVKIEVSENTYVQIQRRAIGSLMPKGTYKTVKHKSKQ